MRKELFIACVLASAMCGCGYADGDLELGPLEPIPTACTSSDDCVGGADNQILGVCEGGTCMRTCSSTAECQDNAICDGSICRPVVDCPALTFADNTPAKDYSNRKCIQVFSHTPALYWSTLAAADVELTEAHLNSAVPTDFTSENYTFTIPRAAMTTGFNFGVVTYAGLKYVQQTVVALSAVAECLRPQQVQPDGTYKDYDNNKPNYDFIFENEPLTIDIVPDLCYGAVSRLRSDFYLENSEQPRISFEEYKKMIATKQTCADARKELEKLKTISTLITSFGGSANSSTYDTANVLLNYLNNPSGNYSFPNDGVDIFNTCGKQDSTTKVITDIDDKYLCHTDHADDTATCNNVKKDCVKKLSLIPLTKDGNFVNAITTSLNHACLYGIGNMATSSTFAMFSKNEDLQLTNCISAPHFANALVNLEKYTSEKAEKILFSGSPTAIIATIGDPHYIWLLGRSKQPLQIKTNSNTPKMGDGLILETDYKSMSFMFTDKLIPDLTIKGTTASITPILNVGIKVDQIPDTPVTKIDYLSSNSSSNTLKGELFYKYTDNYCPNNVCTIGLEALPLNETAGKEMVCGGFTYYVNKVNGYVMLNNRDLKNLSGRSVITNTQVESGKPKP